MMSGDKRLIEPAARQIDAIGHVLTLPQVGRGTSVEAVARLALEHNVFNPKLAAQVPFLRDMAIRIGDESIRHELPELDLEIQESPNRAR